MLYRFMFFALFFVFSFQAMANNQFYSYYVVNDTDYEYFLTEIDVIWPGNAHCDDTHKLIMPHTAIALNNYDPENVIPNSNYSQCIWKFNSYDDPKGGFKFYASNPYIPAYGLTYSQMQAVRLNDPAPPYIPIPCTPSVKTGLALKAASVNLNGMTTYGIQCF